MGMCNHGSLGFYGFLGLSPLPRFPRATRPAMSQDTRHLAARPGSLATQESVSVRSSEAGATSLLWLG
jgi:hypothetical protein